jgi:hypothetical protein
MVYYSRNKLLQATLWGSLAHQIDDDFYISNPKPSIIIVTSTIVKDYKGNHLA